jgi:alkylation response protein AidB-like acyl-CoA dehydrogenase
MDAAELDLLRTSLRHLLDTTAAGDVRAALVEAGWDDLVAEDPAGAINVLAEEAGRARSAAAVADVAVVWGAGLPLDARLAVVLDGLVLAGGERAERFLVLDDHGLRAVAASDVALVPVVGFDPALRLHRATVAPGAGATTGDATRAMSAGRLALAAQMVGSGEQMLTDTLAYVTERRQYGRAIGSFQTVKHRLAEVKVALTAAAAGVRAAWEAGDGTTAMAAKCLAGRAQQLASTHCFQVHGGIAFTVEHGFQQWVRRGLLLDLLLGGHEQLTAELGPGMLDSGRVPRVPALHL